MKNVNMRNGDGPRHTKRKTRATLRPAQKHAPPREGREACSDSRAIYGVPVETAGPYCRRYIENMNKL